MSLSWLQKLHGNPAWILLIGKRKNFFSPGRVFFLFIRYWGSVSAFFSL